MTKVIQMYGKECRFKIQWKTCNYQKTENKNTVTRLALYYKHIGKTNSWTMVDGTCFRRLQSSVVQKN